MDPVLECLVAARKKLDKPENWIQKAYHIGHQRMCLAGAIGWSSDSVDYNTKAREFLAEMLGEIPEKWNDAVGRTHTEVLAALDRAIDLRRDSRVLPEHVDLGGEA